MNKLRDRLTCAYLNFRYDQRGQALLEYAIVFSVAVMGIVAYLTLMQANFNAGIQRQMNQLVITGQNFF